MDLARTACAMLAAAIGLGAAGCSGDDGRPAGGGGTLTGTSTTTPETDGDGHGGGGHGTGSTGGGSASTSDGGAGADGGATTSKKKNAEGPCASGDECESGVCFEGGKGSWCTVACTPANAATVCVAPFTGSCNQQGYCKRD